MASLKVKEILCFLYSCLLFISGIFLIGISVVLSYKLIYHFKFIPSSSIGPFIVFFVLGFVHLLITWLGVKGPAREHDFHIILFIVLTAILLIAECAVGVWSVMLWDEVDIESVQLMTDSFDQYAESNFADKTFKKEWSKLEMKFECCGLNSYTEYKQLIPLSCCTNDIENGTCTVYQTGCKKPLTRYVKMMLIDATILGFCCVAFQALGIFTFISFLRSLKAERAARIARRVELQRSLSQDMRNSETQTPPVSAPPSAPPPSTTVAT